MCGGEKPRHKKFVCQKTQVEFFDRHLFLLPVRRLCYCRRLVSGLYLGHGQRVDRFAVQFKLEMEMGIVGDLDECALADCAELLTGVDGCAFFYPFGKAVRQVAVAGDQPVAVVDYDRVSGKRYPRGGYEVKDMSILNTPEPEHKVHEIKPVSPEEAAAAQKQAEEFITTLMKGMNMDVNISASFDHANNELLLNMEGPDMGILIGKRGQTLDSLQYLTSLVINKEHKEDYIRVKLDTEDYRSRREATLRNLARNIAYKVRRSRKPVALEPMNPYERRIIHSALQNDRYVTTRSEGEEPFRHVIIFMKKKDRKPYPQDEKRQEKAPEAVEAPVVEMPVTEAVAVAEETTENA